MSKSRHNVMPNNEKHSRRGHNFVCKCSKSRNRVTAEKERSLVLAMLCKFNHINYDLVPVVIIVKFLIVQIQLFNLLYCCILEIL